LKLKLIIELQKAERKHIEKTMPSGGIPQQHREAFAVRHCFLQWSNPGKREEEHVLQTTGEKSIQESLRKTTNNFFPTQLSKQGQQ